ncbi:WPE palindromic element domain-containing protein [Wolbachia endosymbiont of Ctenocephalides felis wCfeJ]|uniref:WPE palindromic element domain-containing protein n=1 Tax=Wolbachia endosymbiont of Ctenocephalides felis wCfeJ TaxID=2732594 RepID=UPI001447C1DE|nr:WPE palindromic element domain-containing protein [Wolbachia endosymbiont of Ctenocephalides felis wCfeJ]WCR57747.1 MAG: hypothetical protein PG980_000219 [Wolbachia endosymbiont of Ctenocephalides felis wCfeJ]
MSKSYSTRALSFQRPSMPYQHVTLVLSFWSHAHLYECYRFEGKSTTNGVIRVADTGIQFLAVSLKMLYSGLVYDQPCWIPVLNTELYKHCDTKVVFTKKYVIPVSRHWDSANLILNEHSRWLYNRNWIPVSSTGTTSIVNVLHLLYCSVEYLNNCACIWITTKGMIND